MKALPLFADLCEWCKLHKTSIHTKKGYMCLWCWIANL